MDEVPSPRRMPPGVITLDANPEIDGDKMRELRTQKLRVNLSTAARLMGISVSYLSLIERGLRTSVSPEVLDRICRTLRVAPKAVMRKRSRRAVRPSPVTRVDRKAAA